MFRLKDTTYKTYKFTLTKPVRYNNYITNFYLNTYYFLSKPFFFDKKLNIPTHYFINFFFFKIFYFNNIFILYLNKNFYTLNWSNSFLNHFYIFNSCFYNFYMENIYLYYKLMSNEKNYFY